MITASEASTATPACAEKKRWLLFGAPLTATWYEFNSKQLTLHTGLFAVTTQSIFLSEIRNMVLEQNILQKWFGLSSVHIATANPAVPEFVVKNIRNGAAFAAELRRLWEQTGAPTEFTAD